MEIMYLKWYFRRCLGLVICVSILLIAWSQVDLHEWKLKPLRPINYPSHQQWIQSNTAMSRCIGYGNSKLADSQSFCEKRFPNTLMIDLTKCGTNALLRFLSQHPQVVRNIEIDEYHFFTHNYNKGLEWYRERMPYSLPGQIVLENTANYFAVEEIPQRVFKLNPMMKLLLVVRNPVERVVSEYAMHKQNFEKRNKTIPQMKPGDPFPPFEMIWKKYLWVFYDTCLERWLKYFSIQQIYIINGDVLRKSPLQELKKIEMFLNIDPYFHEKHFYSNRTRGFYCLSKPRFGQDNCLWEEKGRKHPNVNKTLFQTLKNIFRPHNQRFYQLSGKQFDWDNETASQ